ncbi:MAG: NAD(P)H-binding protein [Candidatus Eisenbacteria bacterium]
MTEIEAGADARSMPRTVAITGAMGFVASHLMPRLSDQGVRMLAVVRPGRDVSALPRLEGVEVRHGELSEPGTLARTFEGAEAVVHLAGLALVPSFLPAMLAAGARGGVFVSSAGVYTQLRSAGADSKRRGEAALRDSPLAFTVLRPSMIYGTPRDRNMVRLLRWIQKWPWVPAPLGGITPQQPVHVDDLVQAILASLSRPIAARGEYDVGGPQPIALSEVIHTAAQALGRRVGILPVPLAPAHAAAVFARRIRVPFPVSPEQVLRLTESKAVDIGPACRDLGFAPRSFRQGITAEVAMMLHH